MKTSFMRRLDYWVGVPLCLLLSGLDYISKIVHFRKRKRWGIKNILFIKLSELGSIILAYPLMKNLKTEYPSANLFFVTFKKNKDIFLLLENIIPDKNILVIRENSIRLFFWDTLMTIIKLHREKIDIIFDLEFFSRFTAILTYLIKGEKRVGFYHYTFEGLYRGGFLTHKIQYNPLLHISKTYLSLSQVIGEEGKRTPELEKEDYDRDMLFPKYISKKEIKERMEKKIRGLGIDESCRLFLLNPGEGALPLREWPLDNFITLSKMILSGGSNYIIIIGAEDAARKGEMVLKSLNNFRCASFIGQTSLEELMELFLLSDALISNDCGLAHLAMVASINKFIIFGPESPQIFAPQGSNNWIIYSNLACSPCLSVLNNRDSACRDNKCLKAISPEDVWGLISETLNIKPG